MFKLLRPASPKKHETGNSRMKGVNFPQAEKTLRPRVIMFPGNGRVKFGGDRLCPMRHRLIWRTNTARTYIARGHHDVGIHRTPRGIGALRTDVRKAARASGRGIGSAHPTSGAGETTWRVLRQPAQSDRAGDGHPDDLAGTDTRKRTRTIRYGRDSPGERNRGGIAIFRRGTDCSGVLPQWSWADRGQDGRPCRPAAPKV